MLSTLRRKLFWAMSMRLSASLVHELSVITYDGEIRAPKQIGVLLLFRIRTRYGTCRLVVCGKIARIKMTRSVTINN